MKDFNGNELHVGDFVAFLEPHYRHMHQGRVVGFTPKQIRIEFLSTHRAYRGGTELEQCLREQSYVAKIQPKEKVDAPTL